MDHPSPSENSPPRTVCTIGNFDGVHRGHVALLARATREAEEEGLRPLALTFDPPPAVVLGRTPVGLLTTTERKVRLIRQNLPNVTVAVKTFDRSLADMTPERFASQVLASELGAVRVVVGRNFRFGHDRSGDLATLTELGRKLGFVAEAAEIVGDERGPWSSSRVRSAIVNHDWEDVSHVLGRPHSITGTVAIGNRLGRTIGFKTANLEGVTEMPPPNGVFAVLVDRVDPSGGSEALGRGVTNIGVRPTLGAGPSIETHLFDFDADLYGSQLRLHFVARLRAERKFAGLDELRAQIERDCDQGRRTLEDYAPDPKAGNAWY